MIRSSDWPTASAALWPKIRSAPLFQCRMMPSRSVATIASEPKASSACAIWVGFIWSRFRTLYVDPASTAQLFECAAPGSARAATRDSQRQIVVLARRHLDLLATQHGERAGDAAPGRVREDHFVDIAALGGDEGREKALLVFP